MMLLMAATRRARMRVPVEWLCCLGVKVGIVGRPLLRRWLVVRFPKYLRGRHAWLLRLRLCLRKRFRRLGSMRGSSCGLPRGEHALPLPLFLHKLPLLWWLLFDFDGTMTPRELRAALFRLVVLLLR